MSADDDDQADQQHELAEPGMVTITIQLEKADGVTTSAPNNVQSRFICRYQLSVTVYEIRNKLVLRQPLLNAEFLSQVSLIRNVVSEWQSHCAGTTEVKSHLVA